MLHLVGYILEYEYSLFKGLFSDYETTLCELLAHIQVKMQAAC